MRGGGRVRGRARVVVVAALAAYTAAGACGGSGSPVRAPEPRGRAVFPAVGAGERARLAEHGLVRAAPPRLREACDRLARRTAWRVVCPTLVPGGRLAVAAVGGVAGASTDFGKGYDISVDSGALRVKGAPDPGHWTFAAGTAGGMHALLTAYGHGEPVSRDRLTVGDVAVTRYREPEFGTFPGVYGGHVVYQWRQGDAVMQVSVHGTRHERVLRGLVLLLAGGPDPSPDG